MSVRHPLWASPGRVLQDRNEPEDKAPAPTASLGDGAHLVFVSSFC